MVFLSSVLRKLARNDDNKRMLFELGALKPLVNLARTGNFVEKKGLVYACNFNYMPVHSLIYIISNKNGNDIKCNSKMIDRM